MPPNGSGLLFMDCPVRVIAKEESLQKKLGQVLKDKKKIEETVEELDRYKRDALQKTWEKVDR